MTEEKDKSENRKLSKKKIRDKGKKTVFNLIYGRTAIIIIMILLQILLIAEIFNWLSDYYVYVYGVMTAFAVILSIYIINKNENPIFKLVWMIPIMVFPVVGVILYLFLNLQLGVRNVHKKLSSIIDITQPYLQKDEDVMSKLAKANKRVETLAEYLDSKAGYPAYTNTEVMYFPQGEDKFEELKVQLRKAKKFIFLEYFIIDEGIMWDTILDILVEKAAEGVEVRVMYDGLCSLSVLPSNYPKKLMKLGIKCKMFAPIVPMLSTAQNNRDHRKILVIDGLVAFNGGVNLADEYINARTLHGHWKDTAVMLTGDAVKSFTLMFLQMWNITEKGPENYEKYINEKSIRKPLESDGFIIPYADSPLDGENVGEEVYLDILYTAKDYVHIMTPYLILDFEMTRALTYAAKRGVDVKIIMPHIPDKWYAFALAKTYYKELIEAGVKIYEYTPGFVHAKVFVSDNEKAVVGSINLDFRSLYLHFECATFIYNNIVINSIEKDYTETLLKSQLITKEDLKKISLFTRISGSILRFIAPLM